MNQLLWTQKQDIGPAARWCPAMVYDSTRARMLLFGGATDTGAGFADTWEWDGENWTQLEDIGPQARWGHGMAYDKDRQRVVLFGGTADHGGAANHTRVSLNDTWEWDGGSWTQMADTGPATRYGVTLAYDSRRQRTVLFGGEIAGTKNQPEALLSDTWIWDGVQWTQEQDSGPSERSFYGMAYDSGRDRIVLFGGLEWSTTDYVLLSDTWEYDAVKWTRVADIGPSPRHAVNLCFTGNATLLFGGGVETLNGITAIYKDTWQWDGKHWTQRQDMGPAARYCAGGAGDTARSRLVLFGGASNSATFGDTWESFERPLPEG